MIVTLEQFGQPSLDRAEQLLAGIPGGMDKALRRAMARTTQHVRAQSAVRVRERYAIGTDALRMNEAVKISYSYSAGSGIEARMWYSGKRLPLYRYEGTSPLTPTFSDHTVAAFLSGGWRMVRPGVPPKAHQLRTTSPKQFNHGFVATFRSGHTGIFVRTGGTTSIGADELREIVGSSIPQMVGNEEVIRKLGEDATAKFDERMTHEVDVLLNGWR